MTQLADGLGEAEGHFRLVADNAPAMMWTAGTDKLCNRLNACWLAFTGRTPEQEHGEGWTAGVHPDDRERCIQLYDSSFEARQPFRIEYRLRRHDGAYRWVLDTGAPRYTPGGEFAGYIGACVEIHDQREAQEDLRRSLEGTTRLLAEKDALLKEIHHRVKNNLQLIMSLLGIRARDVDSVDVRRELADMAGRISNLAQVEELLHRAPDLAMVDFAEYLRQLTANLWSQPLARDVKLTLELQPVGIPIDRAIPLGLLVTEIVLTAQRQAAENPDEHEISLDLQNDEAGAAVLCVGCTAAPADRPEAGKKSIGRRLIEALARQAEAQLQNEPADTGTRTTVRFGGASE